MVSYRKVSKGTALVTFGIWHSSAIATFGGSLLSESRYLRMAKTCTPNGHLKNKIAKNMKGVLFLKKSNVILYFKSYK